MAQILIFIILQQMHVYGKNAFWASVDHLMQLEVAIPNVTITPNLRCSTGVLSWNRGHLRDLWPVRQRSRSGWPPMAVRAVLTTLSFRWQCLWVCVCYFRSTFKFKLLLKSDGCVFTTVALCFSCTILIIRHYRGQTKPQGFRLAHIHSW